jgi:hypothetical protein
MINSDHFRAVSLSEHSMKKWVPRRLLFPRRQSGLPEHMPCGATALSLSAVPNLGDSEPQKGDSTYHAMQMRFVERFRAGGSVQASYTWSKLLSDTDTLTSWLEASPRRGRRAGPSNLGLETLLASFDAANRLVISYLYDLPVGQGKPFLGTLHGAADTLQSGWGSGESLRSSF